MYLQYASASPQGTTWLDPKCPLLRGSTVYTITLLSFNIRFLQDSRLRSLAGDTFEHTQFVEKLDIRRNELQTLPEGIFDGLFNLDEMQVIELLIKPGQAAIDSFIFNV